ncbi:unnamed protein product [Phytophthora fragariaefolia]|uniref:Unnamed protein product n=1 Tax=Phytophthora fragariaefolia TaxID=1490495 RepID=A0A9W6XW20_9STRA|nr:unnamed protein product [Phytophthora fragariaefolia]
MNEFNDELVRLGLVYENSESRWACPAFPVRKTDGEFLQASDYNPVNGDMKAIVGVMQNLQVDLECVKGAWDFYCLINHELLAACPSRKVSGVAIVNDASQGVYAACRKVALTPLCSSTIKICLEGLLNKYLLVWIDDLL